MPAKSNAPVRQRLKKVVMEDKVSAIENMLRVLKSDQYKLLTNYMYLNADDLKVYIDITDGKSSDRPPYRYRPYAGLSPRRKPKRPLFSFFKFSRFRHIGAADFI